MSYINTKGDATLADIVRFIKETVRGQHVLGGIQVLVANNRCQVSLVMCRASASRRSRRMMWNASSTSVLCGQSCQSCLLLNRTFSVFTFTLGVLPHLADARM